MPAKRWNQHIVTGFPSLRQLQTALPSTKMGIFCRLLPEIEHLLGLGQSSKAICESLSADGMDLSYDAFRVYLRRARRRIPNSHPETPTAQQAARERPGVPIWRNTDGNLSEHSSPDPFAGVRRSRQEEARERFDYDPLAPLKENFLK